MCLWKPQPPYLRNSNSGKKIDNAIQYDKKYLLKKLARKRYPVNIIDRPKMGFGVPLGIWFATKLKQDVHNRLLNMRHYDVIHYHFASFLTNDGRELSYLKKMGKIIAVHFRGCDLRQKSINNKLNPVLNCCQECDYPEGSCETEIQFTRIEKARKFADLLFVTTPDLLDFLPEAEHIPFTAPYGIDLDDVYPAPKDEHIFRVVTSSNHDGVDGTEYVENAVDRLKREGRAVELVNVHNTLYEKALSIYKSADVYAGKLRMGYYNNANIECMLMGIPCMSYIREEFLKNILDCPIIITRPETVYDRLKEYMDKPEALKLLSEEGRKFALKYHDPQSVVDKLITKYNCALHEIESKRVREKVNK